MSPRPRRNVVIGADVAEGVNKASCAADAIDADTFREVGCFRSASISPWQFGLELAAMGNALDQALIGVERNNHGHTTLAALINGAHYPRLYKHEHYHRNDPHAKTELRPGWPTDTTTRPQLFDGIAEVLANGTVEIRSLELVQELQKTQNDGGKPKPGGGSHGDLVIALGIAIQLLAFIERFTGDPVTEDLVGVGAGVSPVSDLDFSDMRPRGNPMTEGF